MRRPTGLGEYRTEELEAELEARKQANQYKCPSYYDEEAALQDCECDRCGVQPDNTPLNADDELREHVRGLTHRLRTRAVRGADIYGGHIQEVEGGFMQLILADRKKHELQARLSQLDQLIDIEGKTFNQWSQKDIAHFFDTVGKQYRELEQELENL